MNAHPRITHDARIMGGKPCIRNTRITAGMVLGLLSQGYTRQRILDAYPDLEADDFDAVLIYAAWRLQEQESSFAITM